VYENNSPCEYKKGEHRHWQNWSNSTFKTIEEAEEYAISWLGYYAKGIPISTEMLLIGHKYNGYDTIQIKEIK